MGRVSHVLLVEKSFSLEVKIIRVLVVMIIMMVIPIKMIMIMAGKMNAHHVDIHQPGHFPCPGEKCGKVEQLVFFFEKLSKFGNVTRWFEMSVFLISCSFKCLLSGLHKQEQTDIPLFKVGKLFLIKQWYKLSQNLWCLSFVAFQELQPHHRGGKGSTTPTWNSSLIMCCDEAFKQRQQVLKWYLSNPLMLVRKGLLKYVQFSN